MQKRQINVELLEHLQINLRRGDAGVAETITDIEQRVALEPSLSQALKRVGGVGVARMCGVTTNPTLRCKR